MKRQDFQKHSTPGQNAFNEVRTLFDEMVGEAKRQSQIEQKNAQRRTPLTKVLLALTILACISAVAIGIYGFYNFPYAPIRQTENGYAGKYGKPYSKEDFEKFVVWEKAMFASFASAFIFGLTFGIMDARQRRRRKFSVKQTS